MDQNGQILYFSESAYAIISSLFKLNFSMSHKYYFYLFHFLLKSVNYNGNVEISTISKVIFI